MSLVQLQTFFLIGLISFYGISYCTNDFPETEVILLHSACYGTHTKFRPSCGNTSETVIGIKDVKVGIKLSETSCPTTIKEDITPARNLVYGNDSVTPFTDLWCCDWNQTSDCVFTYDSSIAHVNYKFHYLCTGLSECSDALVVVRSPGRDGDCNNTLYLDNTNYMVMEYACIDKTRINSNFQSSNSLTVTDQALYLQTNGYPNATSGTGSFSCSVQSDICDSGINMYSLDIRMTDGSGQCTQTLSVTGSSFSHTWSCDYNSVFNVTKLTSSDRYLNVTFSGSSVAADESFIWLGFEAQNSSGSLKLSCPPAELMPCTTTTAQAASTGGGGGGIGIGVIIAGVLSFFILLLLLILLCCCYHRKMCCFKNRKVAPDDSNNNPDDQSDLFKARFMTTGVAPANTMFKRENTTLYNDLPQKETSFQFNGQPVPTAPNRLPPLANNGAIRGTLSASNPNHLPPRYLGDDKHEKEEQERKQKKKKKKDKKKRKQEQNMEGNDGQANVSNVNEDERTEKKKKKKKNKRKDNQEDLL